MGKVGKGKLEALYGRCVASSEAAGLSGDSIDNLQRLLGIKDSKAEQIGQKVGTCPWKVCARPLL